MKWVEFNRNTPTRLKFAPREGSLKFSLPRGSMLRSDHCLRPSNSDHLAENRTRDLLVIGPVLQPLHHRRPTMIRNNDGMLLNTSKTKGYGLQYLLSKSDSVMIDDFAASFVKQSDAPSQSLHHCETKVYHWIRATSSN
ncbi:uncharacterized protein [Bemisia tabaci]|uniref:uncharacterized protein n=1 Tax=Bemisia tabaci TaxID=7038 RepID=UPI003B28B07D